MKRTLVTFAILISTCAIALSQNLLPDSICVKLRENMQGFKDRYHSPSITVVVVHDQDIVFGEAVGYADLEKQTPATIHSLYPIMSVTKVFTATMLMQLKEKGMLNLDDKVKQYVPELKNFERNADDITLFQLATHTSGLPRNPPSDIGFLQQVDRWLLSNGNDSTVNLFSSSTPKELLQSLAYIENEYPKYHLMQNNVRRYSNLGYSLLGVALEKATKTDYTTYITKHILEPLKMSHTGFLNELGVQNNFVQGYWYNPTADSFVLTPKYEPNALMPAGGMYSTATDMAKFISFQFKHNSTDANKILSDENKAMMRAFNIGWNTSYPFVLHEGGMMGYRCVVTINPELKLGWIILTNTTFFDFSRINDQFSRILLPFYTPLSKYTGTYHLKGGYGSLTIYQKDGKLYSTYLSDVLPETPLLLEGNNYFSQKAGDSHGIGYEFVFSENSEKVVLNLGQLMWIKE